jgi:hypothetical protein
MVMDLCSCSVLSSGSMLRITFACPAIHFDWGESATFFPRPHPEEVQQTMEDTINKQVLIIAFWTFLYCPPRNGVSAASKDGQIRNVPARQLLPSRSEKWLYPDFPKP